MCNQSLFKWWCHLHYWRNNGQRQFEHRKFDANVWKSSSPKLLNKILRYYIQIVLGYVFTFKVCSSGGAIYIIGEKIAKDNLNIENLMQTFENLLFHNY